MEDVFAVFTTFVIAVLPLAVGVTKAVDLIRNVADKDDSWPKLSWNAASFVLGVGLCVGWQFNFMAPLAAAIPALKGSSALSGVSGQLLTGIAVGAMASFWHEKLDAWSSAASASKATVPTGTQR